MIRTLYALIFVLKADNLKWRSFQLTKGKNELSCVKIIAEFRQVWLEFYFLILTSGFNNYNPSVQWLYTEIKMVILDDVKNIYKYLNIAN